MKSPYRSNFRKPKEPRDFNDFSGPSREKLKTKTNLRFRIEQAAPGALPRYTLKAKRFKDLRKDTR